MNSTSSGFDLRQVVGELREFVKSRGSELQNRTAAPTSSQLELAILASLSGGAKNAKQLVNAISLASAGAVSATSAQVHPLLASLEANGLVATETLDDRKVYSISDLGRVNLDQAAASEDEKSDASASTGTPKAIPSWLSFDPNFLKAASKLAPVISDLAQTGTRQQQEIAAKVLEETRNQLHKILAQD